MKRIIFALFAVMAMFVGITAEAGQQFGLQTPIIAATQSTLGMSASTVVKSSSGIAFTVSVTTAGAAGALYDAATVGAASSVNLIAVVPAAVGLYRVDFPVKNGIVYVPGAAQVSSVSYR